VFDVAIIANGLCRLIEAEYKLDAVAAENEVARALKVKPGSPIFRIERTSYSTGSRPVDYETLYCREISSDSSHALSERLLAENLPMPWGAEHTVIVSSFRGRADRRGSRLN
jgi:hypothetical protein